MHRVVAVAHTTNMGKLYNHVDDTERRLFKNMISAGIPWPQVQKVTGRSRDTIHSILKPRPPLRRKGAPAKLASHDAGVFAVLLLRPRSRYRRSQHGSPLYAIARAPTTRMATIQCFQSHRGLSCWPGHRCLQHWRCLPQVSCSENAFHLKIIRYPYGTRTVPVRYPLRYPYGARSRIYTVFAHFTW